MILINGESKIQELKLAIISIEKVPPSGAVFAGTPHILS
jgi:hypothetical protein